MIELTRDGDVFVLRMDEGENRFSAHVLDGFGENLNLVEAAEGPKALVTVGTGKFFSNGLDIDHMNQPGTDMLAYLYRVHALLARYLLLDCGTVAAVNGHAFGAGAMLALCGDHRVMRADRGYWCLPEVDLGMTFTPGMNALVSSMLSPATAREAMLTGRRYDGVDAAEAGIVHRAAAGDEVLPAAIELARALAPQAGRNLGRIRAELYAPVIHHLHGD